MLDTTSLIALAMVVVVGLPHGAFDAAVARCLGYDSNWRGLGLFLMLYITLVILVVAVWLWQPDITLMGFLIISAWHFGYGDATASHRLARIVQAAAHGGLVVFGISLFHSDQVLPIFAVLTNGDFSLVSKLSQLYSIIVMPLAALYFVLAIWHADMRPRLVELALLCLFFNLTPPLVGFAFYFCVIHTGRHMLHIWRRVRANTQLKSLIQQATFFTSLSWAIGATIFCYLDNGNFDHGLLRVIFIGLAALTVPHMILVDGLFRRDFRGEVV